MYETTPWLTERHGYDPTFLVLRDEMEKIKAAARRRKERRTSRENREE